MMRLLTLLMLMMILKCCLQLDEVSSLNQSVILLEQKLTEAEAARLDLLSNRSARGGRE